MSESAPEPGTDSPDEDLDHEAHDDGEAARQLTADELEERDPGPDDDAAAAPGE